MKKVLYFTWPLLLIALLWGGRRLIEEEGQATQRVGATLYQQHCANCHMDAGQGLRGLIPPVAQADYVAERGAELACGIVNGYAEPLVVNGQTYQQPMPPIEGLSEYEITQLINYLKTAWGPQGEPVRFPAVQAALDSCADETRP
jgi:mono/diheme cytochrome c family protein